MHSRVDVAAVAGPDGANRLTRTHGDGMFAVRRTGETTVHLVGTAAGPLNGDTVELRFHVHRGAVLQVRSAAATIALPSRTPAGPRVDASHLHLEAVVEDGAHLDLALEPMVVCRGAQVRTTTVVRLGAGASVRVVEQVVLGRHGEPGGSWTGRTVVDRHTGDGLGDGAPSAPVLRHTVSSAVVAPPGSGVRGIVTTVALAPNTPWTTNTRGDAVACALAAGGVVVTATGPTLADALRDHDAAFAAAEGDLVPGGPHPAH